MFRPTTLAAWLTLSSSLVATLATSSAADAELAPDLSRLSQRHLQSSTDCEFTEHGKAMVCIEQTGAGDEIKYTVPCPQTASSIADCPLINQRRICYQYNSVPCIASAYCAAQDAFALDCSNIMAASTGSTCSKTDCDGTCLDTAATPVDYNAVDLDNACTRLGISRTFSCKGDDCGVDQEWTHILEDATEIFVTAERASNNTVFETCAVTIGEQTCSCNTDCEPNSDAISYDCSEFTDDECAVSDCGTCVARESPVIDAAGTESPTTVAPSAQPSFIPTRLIVTAQPSSGPSEAPVVAPSSGPSAYPVAEPSVMPSSTPVIAPTTGTGIPTAAPMEGPNTSSPTSAPVNFPTTLSPTATPPVTTSSPTTSGMPSFSSIPSDTPFTSAFEPVLDTVSCKVNSACAARNLTGACCPAPGGLMLECCGSTPTWTSMCALNEGCAALGLQDSCCPTNGVNARYLDCCTTIPDICAEEGACEIYSAVQYKEDLEVIAANTASSHASVDRPVFWFAASSLLLCSMTNLW